MVLHPLIDEGDHAILVVLGERCSVVPAILLLDSSTTHFVRLRNVFCFLELIPKQLLLQWRVCS
jgi:hypothetical protein